MGKFAALPWYKKGVKIAGKYRVKWSKTCILTAKNLVFFIDLANWISNIQMPLTSQLLLQ